MCFGIESLALVHCFTHSHTNRWVFSLNKMKKIILCADDYALTPEISRGIRDLISNKRITATSCMVCSPYFEEESAKLCELDVDIGLHLTLTTHSPLNNLTHEKVKFPLSISQFYNHYFFGDLSIDFIETEFRSQLSLFKKTFGKHPDHIDGHHHIHQLPKISKMLSELIDEESPGSAVRITKDRHLRVIQRKTAIIKTLFIDALGRLAYKTMKNKNRKFTAFSGVYNFSTALGVDDIFQRLFKFSLDGELIMCHPGYSCDLLQNIDSLSSARDYELAYFMSCNFKKLISEENIKLSRLKDL